MSRSCAVIPEITRARARRLRREGMSVTEIARELDMPRSTVGDLVKGVEAVKSCQLCGDPFETDQAHQKFCTPQHRDKHWRIYRRAA